MNASELATPDNEADRTITLQISGNRLVSVLNALDQAMHQLGHYKLGKDSLVASDTGRAALLETTEAIRDELSRQRCAPQSIPTASLYRNLSPEEATQYRQWARDNYEKFAPIEGVWHPIVQLECVAINTETGYSYHYAPQG